MTRALVAAVLHQRAAPRTRLSAKKGLPLRTSSNFNGPRRRLRRERDCTVHALIIEDDPSTAQAVQLMLERSGMLVTVAALGEEGLDLARSYEHDIICLDLDLPDLPGDAVLAALRNHGNTTPVLVISGMAAAKTKLNLLTAGADDYLTKPFHPEELIARVQAIVRRRNGHSGSLIRTGGLEIDIDAKLVRLNRAWIHLSPKEFAAIELLALRRGRSVSREMFLDHLYDGNREPTAKAIDVIICNLRRKLRFASGGPPYIHTVGTRGYLLSAPDAPVRLTQAA